ncbi:MAG: hypothetical protein ACK4RK_13410 [Gemmataceae bacterium]
MRRHFLRAPRDHGAVVADPPLADAGALLTQNRQLFDHSAPTIAGRPLPELRRMARRETVAAAEAYLREAGEPLPPAAAVDSLLLAGHQPELFHPGVWVKNFALHGLAQRFGRTPLNLIVDSDMVRSTAARVPVRRTTPASNGTTVALASVHFDWGNAEIPYEERAVHSEEIFREWGERTVTMMAEWGYTPLLKEFWPEVTRQARRTLLLGERFAAARRHWERRWGCHNLEVPMSRLCQTAAFAWFACHILCDLPRFHAVHNQCLREYRQFYGIKSRHHPVAELTIEGDWWEAPFWGWRTGQQRRGRLLARQRHDRIEVRQGDEPWPTLPASPDQAVPVWQALAATGHKARTRALTTTLFARLLLGDLFLHGIGGGKYDELTDAIMLRFYDIESPEYLVLSATLLLPLPVPEVTDEDWRRVRRTSRDFYWNPQRYFTDLSAYPAEVAALLERKQQWINYQPKTATERRQRFEELRQVTAQLRPFLRARTETIREQLHQCLRLRKERAILQRRDYAFCLYPAEMLENFFRSFLMTPG